VAFYTDMITGGVGKPRSVLATLAFGASDDGSAVR
jgi:hypothetical protein